jgi:hypothetical protein
VTGKTLTLLFQWDLKPVSPYPGRKWDRIIFYFQILEIFPDLWYSIKQVGCTGRFRLIMVKPIIDELAVLKGYIPKSGSLPG